MVPKLMAGLPEPDLSLFATCESKRQSAQGFQETTRQGPWGLVRDMALLVRPWGFDIHKIASDVRLYLWHGKLDSIAPYSHAEYLVRALRIPPSRRLAYLALAWTSGSEQSVPPPPYLATWNADTR